MTFPMPKAPQYLFLLASARRDGNAELLARRAAMSLPKDAQQTWLRLMDLPLPPFEDIRHAGDGTYPQPTGHQRVLLDATLGADEIVFVAPLYWYSVPASAKLYLDYWSGWMRVPGCDFKARMAGKRASAISAISDEDAGTADPLIETLRLSAQYLAMRWSGALLGHGNRPGDVLRDDKAMAAADDFFASR